MKRYKHGGRRPGAGRKSKGETVPTTFRLPIVIREFLESDGGDMTAKAVAILKRSREFQRFARRSG